MRAVSDDGRTTLFGGRHLIGNGLLFNALSARMSGMDAGIGSLDARMLALESSMNTSFDLIMGRLSGLDTRLSVLEDRSKPS